jgi:hypothetical protein
LATDQRSNGGIVPDFLVDGPPSELAELKCLACCATRHTYTAEPPADFDRPNARLFAVRRRAATIQSEYVNKARRCDRRHSGTVVGQVGPIENKLAQYGAIRPLVFGAFSEINAEFDELLIKAAHVGANRSWRYMHVAAEEKAVGVLLWHLRRQIGGAAARANAAFLLGRVSFAAGGSTNPAAAQARRVLAERQCHRRSDPSTTAWDHRQWQYQGSRTAMMAC